MVVVAGLAVGLRGAVLGATGAAVVVVAALAAGTLTAVASPPCDVESAYHCVRVDRDPERPSGRVLVLDDLRHSYVDLGDPRHLEFDYTRWIGDAVDGSAPRGRPLEAVFVGGGGFTLPRWLAATRPGSRSRVLEVDGDLVDVGRDRLGLRTSPALRVLVGDARMTMRDQPARSADVVVGDAFGGRAVPWHLATREWARAGAPGPAPGGVYALNVIDQGGLRLMRAEAATLLDVFADVRLIARPGLARREPGPGGLGRRMPASVGSRSRGARTHGRAVVARLAARLRSPDRRRRARPTSCCKCAERPLISRKLACSWRICGSRWIGSTGPRRSGSRSWAAGTASAAACSCGPRWTSARPTAPAGCWRCWSTSRGSPRRARSGSWPSPGPGRATSSTPTWPWGRRRSSRCPTRARAAPPGRRWRNAPAAAIRPPSARRRKRAGRPPEPVDPAELERALAQLEQVRAERDTAAGARDAAQEQWRKAQAELEEARAEVTAQVAAADERRRAAEQARDEAVAATDQARSELRSAQSEREFAQQQLQGAERGREEAVGGREEAARELHRASSSRSEAEAERDEAVEARRRSRASATSWRPGTGRPSAALEAMTKERDAMREQRDAARAERDEIRDQAKAAPAPARAPAAARAAPGPRGAARGRPRGARGATRACGCWPRAPWSRWCW